MDTRHYSPFDRLVVALDQSLKTLAGPVQTSERSYPAAQVADTTLSDEQRRTIAGLMRVNHSGEICAQALYQGQALTAKLPNIKEKMERAAIEENDHLDWCAKRLNELQSRPSLLNPLWYAGSFAIGAAAGFAGDKWSLGFVAETEKQVVRHLEAHLTQLPADDLRDRAILEQMKQDEGQHATQAIEAGGATLPAPVQKLMSLTSKIMTKIAFHI